MSGVAMLATVRGVVGILVLAAAPAASPAPAASRPANAAALVDPHAVLGREYPCFELKQIDWEAVGRELLPRADGVDNERDFGLLCTELMARLEDSHAFVGPGTAKPPTPDFPAWDPGFGCLVDDRGKSVVYHVDAGGPADKAGVRRALATTPPSSSRASRARPIHRDVPGEGLHRIPRPGNRVARPRTGRAGPAERARPGGREGYLVEAARDYLNGGR